MYRWIFFNDAVINLAYGLKENAFTCMNIDLEGRI